MTEPIFSHVEEAKRVTQIVRKSAEILGELLGEDVSLRSVRVPKGAVEVYVNGSPSMSSLRNVVEAHDTMSEEDFREFLLRPFRLFAFVLPDGELDAGPNWRSIHELWHCSPVRGEPALDDIKVGEESVCADRRGRKTVRRVR